MKKFISILIASLLMLQCVAFADYQLGTENDEVVVLGEANPYEVVSFVLLDCDSLECDNAEDALDAYYDILEGDTPLSTDAVYFFGTTRADANGEWNYAVNMSGIEEKNVVLVTGTNNGEFIQYASVSFRANIIPELKAAALVDDDFASLTNAITEKIAYIADSWSLYKTLSNKKFVAQFVAETINGFEGEGAEELAVLKQKVDKAILLCAIAEGKINNFDKAFYFDYDVSLKATIKADGLAKILELLKGGNYLDEADYIENAKLQLLLQNFNYNKNQNGDNLAGVLEELAQALVELNEDFVLDISDFKDLKSSDESKIAKKLAGKGSVSLAKMQENLDDLIEDLLDDGDDKGFGGGPSIPYSGSAIDNVTEENIQGQKYIYSDSSLAPWSADAVIYLSDRNIVKGYDDGSFKPLNDITRAEFTKIVVEAFYGITAYEYQNAFSDVPANAWYAPYVNKAYENGVVSGTGAGKFNPNATITREDMAVILYNAALKHNLIAPSEAARLFEDDATISSYAKDAVYTLKNLGVVNGVGTGSFEPKSNANRASACQMLYALMTKTAK